jgi:hypothetical protein
MFRRYNNVFYIRERDEFFVYLFVENQPMQRIPDTTKKMLTLVADKWYIKQNSNRTMV